MYVFKNFSLPSVIRFSGKHLKWIIIWTVVVTCFIEFLHYLMHQGYDIPEVKVPWLPISVIGTAVAFYVGFKNNSSYDRLWEARKIWGGIVNSSRAWGSAIIGFIVNQFTEHEIDKAEIDEVKKLMIYRHIAWLYALRSQLLIPTSWEHIRQKQGRKRVERQFKTFGVGLYSDDVTQIELRTYLKDAEYDELINYQNTATQIVNRQSEELAKLRSRNLIDDFRHMELQNILNEFYDLQGKSERIKKFPLPRQYGSMSLIFIYIFIGLLPWGMVTVFHELGEWGAWLSIPFTIIVGWVFMMMELVGDYSENPFEGLGNDIPMLSLCRVIEIDLREMIQDTDIPPSIEPINGVLM
jgi:putative membrane protein